MSAIVSATVSGHVVFLANGSGQISIQITGRSAREPSLRTGEHAIFVALDVDLHEAHAGREPLGDVIVDADHRGSVRETPDRSRGGARVCRSSLQALVAPWLCESLVTSFAVEAFSATP